MWMTNRGHSLMLFFSACRPIIRLNDESRPEVGVRVGGGEMKEMVPPAVTKGAQLLAPQSWCVCWAT